MKKHDSDSKIVMALVIVLALIVLGVIVIQMTKTLTGTWVDLGGNVGTFLATVGGAIVGVAGAYVTNTPTKTIPVSEFTEVTDVVPPAAVEAVPADDAPDEVAPLVEDSVVPPTVMSADEAMGGIGHADYTEVSEEELNNA